MYRFLYEYRILYILFYFIIIPNTYELFLFFVHSILYIKEVRASAFEMPEIIIILSSQGQSFLAVFIYRTGFHILFKHP